MDFSQCGIPAIRLASYSYFLRLLVLSTSLLSFTSLFIAYIDTITLSCLTNLSELIFTIIFSRANFFKSSYCNLAIARTLLACSISTTLLTYTSVLQTEQSHLLYTRYLYFHLANSLVSNCPFLSIKILGITFLECFTITTPLTTVFPSNLVFCMLLNHTVCNPRAKTGSYSSIITFCSSDFRLHHWYGFYQHSCQFRSHLGYLMLS